jgi:hypothetical protein
MDGTARRGAARRGAERSEHLPAERLDLFSQIVKLRPVLRLEGVLE